MKRCITKVGHALVYLGLVVSGALVVGTLLYATWLLVVVGAAPILEIGLGQFIGGRVWAPESSSYGILPLVLGSVYSLAGCCVLVAPLGLLVALFLRYSVPPRLARPAQYFLEFMGCIPTVVYGLFAMTVVMPAMATLLGGRRQGLVLVVITLCLAALPLTAYRFYRVLQKMPTAVHQQSLALGALKSEAWFGVVLRGARRPLCITFFSCLSHIAGETMLVMMVAGNVANMPKLLGSMSTLSTVIATGGSGEGLGQYVLYSLALVLLVLCALGNAAFYLVSYGRKKQ